MAEPGWIKLLLPAHAEQVRQFIERADKAEQRERDLIAERDDYKARMEREYSRVYELIAAGDALTFELTRTHIGGMALAAWNRIAHDRAARA